MALAVFLCLLTATLVACCSVGTLPLGVLGGHIWGRLAARTAAPALGRRTLATTPPAAPAVEVAVRPAPEPEPDLEDENYTLALAQSILARNCQPAALAATAIEFGSSPEAVARWLQAYRDAIAGPVPDSRPPPPASLRRRGRGLR